MVKNRTVEEVRGANAAKHWSYSYDEKSDQYMLFDASGLGIAAVSDKQIAILIVNAANEHINGLRTFGTPNTNVPRSSTLLRSLMDSVRRSRQRFDDRALEGISVYPELSACTVHVPGECPEFNPHDLGMTSMTCQYDIRAFILALPDGTKYKAKIERMQDETK